MPAAMGIFTALLVVNARRAGRGRRRAARLLRPFLLWGLIYGALRVADTLASGQPILADLPSWLPPWGTTHQLWFLPFAFVIGEAAARLPSGWAEWRELALIGGASLAATTWLLGWQRLEIPMGIEVLGDYIPAAIFGVAFAEVGGLGQRKLMVGAAALFVGTAAGPAGAGLTGHSTLGVPLVALALAFPSRGGATARFTAEPSMAIYLVHPLLLAVVLRLVTWSEGSALPALATIAASLAVGVALCSTRVGRRLT